MSKTIDEKVVEMRFDNKQFESNVATSMSTLEKLKKSLKLDGVSKGLEKINSAAKSNNLESLGNAANTVGLRFNAMYTIADQALRNITTRVQHTAESMVKALTIDPIMSGFKEYETQINAVQTIMANTSSKGTTLDQVNAALDELNKYADLTIYNFTEMTRNIGTFTAAGIDLDTSVSAIQGIANLAAVSGSTSQQASTAMYQLSQALASGTVKLMDWNSVVNAGMGGQVFQDALKETARVHGIAIDKMIEEQGSFRETLSEGWITSEILTETLEKFTMAAEEGSEQWEKYKQSLMDTGYTEAQAESILKMANTATDAATKVKTFTQLWDTLKEAAQSGWTQTWEYIIGDFEEAKAFLTELHGFFSGIIEESASRRNNLIGEVFSSNWEKLIGKINEAGVETSQFEDSIRKVVGDNDLDSLIEKYGSIQKAAEEGAISSNTLKKALDGIGSTEAGTKISGFVDGLKEINRNLDRGDVGEDVKKLQTALKELGYDIGETGIDGIIGRETEKAIKAFQKANGLTGNGMGIVGPKTLDALEKAGIKVEEINGNVNDLHDSCDSLVDVITKTNGRELLLESLMNVIKTIHRPLSAVNEALRDTFSISPDSLYNALEALNKFTSKFVMKGVLDATTWSDLLNGVKNLGIEIPDFEGKLTEALKSNSVNIDSLIEKYGSLGDAFNDGAISIDAIKDVLLSFDGITESILLGGESADKVRRTFEGLFAILDIIRSVVGGGFKAAFEILGEIFGSVNTDILGVTGNVGDVIVAFRDWLKENEIITKGFDKLVRGAKTVINTIKKWIAAFKGIPSVRKSIDGITAAFEKFTGSAEDMAGTMSKVKEWFSTFKESSVVQTLLAGLSKAFKWFGSTVEGAVVGLGEWFEVFKQTEGVQLLIEAVNNLVEAFGKLFSGELDANNFVTVLGDSLGKLLISLPKMAIKIGKDFIAGFTNGLVGGVSDVVSSILEFCSNFVSAFASALGIHSPSTISYQNAIDWWQGFINGCKEMLGPVMEAIQPFIDFIKNIFTSLWDYITDESGNLDWGKLVTGGITIESLIILKQLTTAIEKFANAATSFSSIFSSISGVFTAVKTAITNIGKAAAHDFNATAVLKMAGAIAILAASIWLLCQIDDVGKAWNAVAVIFVLALIVMGLAFALNQLGSASLSFSAATKQLDLKGLKAALLQIGIALLMMAVVVKMIGDMDPEAASRGLKSLGAMAIGLIIFIAALGGISLYAKDIDGVIGMAVKLSLAMLLMVGICKLAGKLSAKELFKGVVFGSAFAIFVRSITAVAKSSGNNVGKVGGMVIGIAVAMTLMIYVCKLASKLSAEEMLKGAAFATAFVFFVRELVAVTKIGKKQKIAELSGLLLSVSLSLAMMVGVCKLVGLLSVDEMIKGGLAIAAFAVLMRRMVDIVKIGDDVQIAKVSATLIGMSTAVMLLAGTAVILGMVDLASLAKGVIAVSILGSIVSLMAYSLKGIASATGAADVKVMVIALAATVAIMAGAIVALSQIKDRKELWGAVAAMSILMGVFTLMISSLKLIASTTIPLKPLIALGAVVLILTGVIVALSYVVKDAKTVLAGAGSIAGLMLVMVGVLAILGVMSLEIGPAMIGIFALAALGLVLRELVWVLASMSDIENALSNVVALSALFAALVGMLGVIAVVGSLIMGFGGMGIAAIVTGLGALSLTALAIKGGVALFKSIAEDLTATMKELANASKEAKGIDVNAFDGVPRLLSIISQIGTTSLRTGIKDFFTLGGTTIDKFQRDGVAFFKAMGVIGEAASEVKIGSDAKDNIDTVLGVAESLADLQQSLTGITGFIGWLRGVQGLDAFGENAKKFFEGMSTGMGSVGNVTFKKPNVLFVISTAKSIGEIQQSLTGIEGFIGWLRGVQGLDTFGENAKTFFEAMSTAMSSDALGNAVYNKEGTSYVIDTAKELSTLQNSLKGVEGFADWLNRMYGDGNLANFAENAQLFFSGMTTAMSSIGEAKFNKVGITFIISTAQRLAELQSSLQGVEGFIGWLDKMSSNLGTFGINARLFFSGMSTAMSSIGEAKFKKPNILFAISTAQKLADLQTSLQGVEGFIGWVDKMSSNLGNFGTNAATFFTSISTAMSTVGGGSTYNTESLDNILAFATKLEEFQDDKLQGVEGFMDWLDKVSNNLGTFGINASTFIRNMSTVMSSVGEGEYNSEKLNSIIFFAYRLKYLINALTDLDDSGIRTFSGGFLSKGAVAKIAETMADFGKTVGEIDTGKMSIAVSSATRLKNLIDSLAGIDTSGIDKFKVDTIATEMKGYANKVAEIDTATVSSSITSANRLKAFVAGLAGLDSSGISNFKIGSIGQSLATYNRNVSGFNGSKVNASIASANRLKDFITSLSGLDTSGIGVFKSAVGELSTVNVGSIVEAFSGASESMSTVGTNLITALSKGMRSGSAAINSIAASIVSSMSSSIKSKSASLATAGKALASSVASGFTSNRSAVVNSAGSVASSGESAVRGYYRSFFQAGNYLVTGFARGIELSTWVAKQAAKKMAEDAMNEANTTLDVGSPSKEFIKIGGYVAEGFAIGISDLSYKSTDAAEGMATSAMNTTRTAMSKVLDAINTDMDAQPTIRPVVDLSDVQTGVNAINGLFNTTKSVGVQANLNAIGYSMNAMRQNGKNDDVISAINKLNDKLDGVGNTYNTINGVTYDDGSNVTDAIETLVRYAKIGGRV